jgi:endo-1,4-beta-xylanase
MARQADPGALLVWNENWLQSDSKYCDAKREATLKLLRELKRRNCPIDVLGLQAHLKAEIPTSPALPKFLRQVTDLGVKVAITELDLREHEVAATCDQRDRIIAERYRELLSASNKSLTYVQTWGLSDRYTWINNDNRNRRADGLASRPLPFDSELKPKPAYTAMVECLRRVS